MSGKIARLNLTEQQQDQENNEDQTNNARWPIAPAPAMAPSRDDAKQDQNQDDDEDCTEWHVRSPPVPTGPV